MFNMDTGTCLACRHHLSTFLRKLKGVASLAAIGTAAMVSAQSNPINLYVAPNGNDSWSGTRSTPNSGGTDGPKKTIDGARDRIRIHKIQGTFPSTGAVINILPGTYRRTTVLDLGVSDGGLVTGPVVYRATTPGQVIIDGGRDLSGWTKVTNSGILSRLRPSARPYVYECNLIAQGITNYGTVKRRRFSEDLVPAHMEMNYKGKPMTLARFPNSGWLRTGTVTSNSFTSATAMGLRPFPISDVWYHGFPKYNYADEWNPVTALDFTNNKVTLGFTPKSGLGRDTRFRIVNVLNEVDAPNEYFIDRSGGKLYFFPPEGSITGTASVSVMEDPLIRTNQTNFIRFEGLTFRNVRGTAVLLQNGQDVDVTGCTFEHVGLFGLVVGNCQDSSVKSSNFRYIGASAIRFAAGNRMTLAPGNGEIVNNDVNQVGRITYSGHPAIGVMGVGNRVAYNRVVGAPYQGIMISGNDLIVERNEVAFVSMETADDGAIYTGADVTTRGCIIRDNLIHDVPALVRPTASDPNAFVVGVYLDSLQCGTEVTGNVFVRCSTALFLNGGSDNTVKNNIAYQCSEGFRLESPGMTWLSGAFTPGNVIYERLMAVPYNVAPYSVRYPTLPGILADNPRMPKRNRIDLNVVLGGNFAFLDGYFSPTLNPMFGNWQNIDPGFASPSSYNFSVAANAPILGTGFQQVNMVPTGTYVDTWRTTIPARAISP